VDKGYDLGKLGSDSFEHMANFLVLRVLGAGHTGFGPGPDAGRDGYFQGEAPYPSEVNRWSGTWYIQSKFHAPNLTSDAQKWLLGQVKGELKEFSKNGTRRIWPDNWIIVTNVDPSGVAETGAFDAARREVSNAYPQLADRFHIWGGRKLLNLLSDYPRVAQYYGHFLTPGHVISELYEQLHETRANIEAIVRNLVVSRFRDEQFTKLEQAGSTADTRPRVHDLFTDLPFVAKQHRLSGMAARSLAAAVSQNHSTTSDVPSGPEWRAWRRHPSRARIWFIKGGPGQGKSTLTQYLVQVQRAAILLGKDGPAVVPSDRAVAKEIRRAAEDAAMWPVAPRIPILVELKEYARWYGDQASGQPRGILTYLVYRITEGVEQTVYAGTLMRAFETSRWLFVFDGLDEVPSDVKDEVAREVGKFVDDVLTGCNSDSLTICTSRPQGYSGQFDQLDAAAVILSALSPAQALECARPVLKIDRTDRESADYFETLKQSIQSAAVQELMTTPLQAHIMAIVVRDGGRPPERKWQLFENFYNVIRKREANRNLTDKNLSTLLRESGKVIKALHNRLGFILHAKAETSKGAQASLDRADFEILVHEVVSQLQDDNVEQTVKTLMEATTVRLVLVNTPDNAQEVRFDIRPLQEFFAAEFIYEGVSAANISKRLSFIAGDAHWREVTHFVFSALIENNRQTELTEAVKVLEDKNGELDESAIRTVKRRVARGAVVAARLAQEGVLEHDKRIRNQFRRSLEPAFATTDHVVIGSISGISAPHTQSWLFDVLSDYLEEHSEPESVGAAVMLSMTLPTSHNKSSEIKARLLGASEAFRSVVFALVGTLSRMEARDSGIKFSSWYTEVVLQTVMQPAWIRLSEEGLEGAYLVLQSDGTRVKQAAVASGLPDRIAKLCPHLFSLFDGLTGPVIARGSARRGTLDFTYFARVPDLNFKKWGSRVWKDFASAPGILGLMYRIFALAHSPTTQNLQTLLDAVGDSLQILYRLPSHVQSFLPVDRWDTSRGYHPEVWGRMTSEDIANGVSRDYFGCDYTVSVTSLETVSDWESLIDSWPHVALDMLASEGSTRRLSTDEINSVFTKLAARAADEPSFMILEPGLLGSILSNLEPGLERMLRDSIVQAGGGPVRTKGMEQVRPYRLELPDESCVLPHIVCALLSSVGSARWPYDFYPGHEPLTMNDVGTIVRKYSENSNALLTIALNLEVSQIVRASALIMYLLHPQRDPTRASELYRLLGELQHAGARPWYLKGVATAFELAIASCDLHAIKSLGAILHELSGDFESRVEADSIFENWRQSSSAPVTNSSTPELWN
jgi:hypothetical protein